MSIHIHNLILTNYTNLCNCHNAESVDVLKKKHLDLVKKYRFRGRKPALDGEMIQIIHLFCIMTVV